MKTKNILSEFDLAVTKRLKMARLALGVRQTELIKVLEVSSGTYSNWEQGTRAVHPRHLVKISDEFGFSLEWFYQGRLRSVEFNMANKIEELMAEAA